MDALKGDQDMSQVHEVRNLALVLGGGGAAGIAWMIGVVAGLAQAGLDLTEAADPVVGTSAGTSTAACAPPRTPTSRRATRGSWR